MWGGLKSFQSCSLFQSSKRQHLRGMSIPRTRRSLHETRGSTEKIQLSKLHIRIWRIVLLLQTGQQIGLHRVPQGGLLRLISEHIFRSVRLSPRVCSKHIRPKAWVEIAQHAPDGVKWQLLGLSVLNAALCLQDLAGFSGDVDLRSFLGSGEIVALAVVSVAEGTDTDSCQGWLTSRPQSAPFPPATAASMSFIYTVMRSSIWTQDLVLVPSPA